MAIELHTLGRLSIHRDGSEITPLLGQPSAAALLVYLSIERTVTRDQLTGVFWPDQETRKARHSLSQMLYAIRQQLGAPWVDAEGERLRVRDDVWVDAIEFVTAVSQEDSDKAVALYRGRFLEGWHLGSTPEFEHWAEVQRSRCARMHRDARRARLERLVERGDLTAAASEARGWVDSEPLEPDGQRRLAELLLAAGQPAEAAHQVAEYRARLEREELPLPRFVEEIEVASREALPAPRVSPIAQHVAPSGPAGATTVAPVRSSDRRRRWVAPAAAFIGIVAVVATILVSRPPAIDLPSQRVAVMPFNNLTADQSLDAVGRLAADWITDGLARTGVVEIASASEVLWALADGFADEASPADPAFAREIGMRTGSGTVVYGSIFSAEQEIVFDAEIVDASTGTLLAPIIGVRGPITDPMPVIDDLREQVMGALAIHLDPTLGDRVRMEKSQPPRYSAYLAYIQGMTHFSRQEFREASLLLERAADLDSTFPLPLVISGFAASMSGSYARADSLARRADARRDRLTPYDRHRLDALLSSLAGDRLNFYRSQRAATNLAPGGTANVGAAGGAVALNRPHEALELYQTLDPYGPLMSAYPPYWGTLTRAYHLLGMHERELEEARRGRQQFPMSIQARLYELRAVAALGRGVEAEQLVAELDQLPPQSGPTPARVMQIAAMELRAHGDATTARSILQRSLSWFQSRPADELGRHRRAVATSYYLLEDWDAAEDVFDVLAVESPGRADLLGPIGTIAARRGDRKRALEIAHLLSSMDAPYAFGEPALWRARIAAQLGDPGEAVELLRLALEEGAWDLPRFHTDPDLEPLRDFTPFRELLEPRR